jgi:hypothetical protein
LAGDSWRASAIAGEEVDDSAEGEHDSRASSRTEVGHPEFLTWLSESDEENVDLRRGDLVRKAGRRR